MLLYSLLWYAVVLFAMVGCCIVC